MSKYNNSKIYKIIDNSNGNIYIGSTTHKYLSQRLVKHRYAYKLYLEGCKKYMTSFKILENGDYDIMLLENVNCETKDQLYVRERYYIETLECVNMVVPGRTKQEYYGDNKQMVCENVNQYYKNNKEAINERLSQIIDCECGSTYTHCHKLRHCKSKKHQTFINSK